MGFLDKVKAAAQEVAQETKKAASSAQTKMEVAGLRRKRDDAAKQLGYLLYQQRTQGGELGSEADPLVSEMASLDAQIAAEEAAPAPAEPPAEAPAPAEPPPPAEPSPPVQDEPPPEGGPVS